MWRKEQLVNNNDALVSSVGTRMHMHLSLMQTAAQGTGAKARRHESPGDTSKIPAFWGLPSGLLQQAEPGRSQVGGGAPEADSLPLGHYASHWDVTLVLC